jgi:hypothetical protein
MRKKFEQIIKAFDSKIKVGTKLACDTFLQLVKVIREHFPNEKELFKRTFENNKNNEKLA